MAAGGPHPFEALLPARPADGTLPATASAQAARRDRPGLRWAVVGLVLGAVGMFAASYFQPWWQMVLFAPQYPRGLHLEILLTGLAGDVREINMLNHYIGMTSLDHAAAFERAHAGFAIGALGVVVVALALQVGRRLNWLVVVPGLLFPLGFVVDSFAWMYSFGHGLDPRAPLHVPPFTPQLFGGGTIGQFYTWAGPSLGFWLALGGVGLLSMAAYLRWRVCARCPLAASCSHTCPRHLVQAPPLAPAPPFTALLALAAGALGLGGSLTACGRPEAAVVDQTIAARVSATTERDAGPQRRALPVGAVVARDGDDLRRLLLDAAGPAVIGLADRTYHGDYQVRRKVAIVGSGGSVLFGSGMGTVVQIKADGVELANVTVRNAGRRQTQEDAAISAIGTGIAVRHVDADRTLGGIALKQCQHCVIEACRITGVANASADGATAGVGHGGLAGDAIKLWESHDTRVERCVVHGSRDVVVWYSRRVLLDGNVVHGSRYGTHFMYAHDAVVRRSRVVGNVVGIFIMYSQRVLVEDNELAGARGAAGVGLGCKDSDALTVRGNWLVGNTTGLYLDRSPVAHDRTVHVTGNVVAQNAVALRLHSAQAGVQIAGNDIHGNGTVVEVDGGGDALGLDVRGNHWSDYAGYDLDGDGTGDVPFEIKKLSGDMTENHPDMKLLHGTLALGLVDAVARTLPVFATRLVLKDGAPAMDPGPLHGRSHRSGAVVRLAQQASDSQAEAQ